MLCKFLNKFKLFNEYSLFYTAGRIKGFITGLNKTLDQTRKTFRDSYKMCGTYLQDPPSLCSGVPMRVDCEDPSYYARYVIVQQGLSDNLGFSLNELEVYEG